MADDWESSVCSGEVGRQTQGSQDGWTESLLKRLSILIGVELPRNILSACELKFKEVPLTLM